MRVTYSTKLLAAIAVAAACGGVAKATVIFNDTFGSSTLNSSTNSPTATSTNYDIASAKDGTGSAIASGDLGVAMAATTGGIVEAQALFTNTPVVLSAVGDFVELKGTFEDTSGNPLTMYFGLFDSGGSAPLNTLNNGTTGKSGLNSSQTNDATGGVAGWTGYSDVIQSTSSSKIASRPAQTQANNTSQDLLSNDASGSQSYQGGTTIGSAATTGAVAAATAGNTYNVDYTIAVTAVALGVPSEYQITSDIYSGTADTGTPLATISETDTSFLYNNFDGLAVGWRETSDDMATQFDFSSLSVSVAPEPSALSLLALAGLAIRRRK